GLSLQYDVRDDERAGNRTPPGSNHRHADRGVSIDRRLHFLRIDLQPSDVDDAAPSTEEVIAVAPPFHHIARVDEAVVVGERRVFLAQIADGVACGTQPKRTIVDSDVDI